MKRLLAFILAIALVLALGCGCSKSGEGASASPSASAPSASQPAANADLTVTGLDKTGGFALPLTAEKQTFTVFVPDAPFLQDVISSPDEIDELCGSTIQIEDLTNIHLKFTRAADPATQIPLIVASGEYPDMWWQCINFYAGGVAAMVDQGVVRVMTDYMDKLPHYKALLDGDEQLRRDATNISGDIISLYTIKTDYDIQNMGIAVRGDWAEGVGMSQGDFVTYDDFYNYLKAANAKYGAKLYPTMWVFGQSGDMATGYGINLGAGNNTYPLYHVGNEVRFGYLQPEAKELVSMMSRWYDEGLIVPEFIQLESSRMMDKSILYSTAAAYYIGGGQFDEYYANTDNPDFAMTPIREPMKDKNPGLSKLFNAETRMADSLEVSTNVKNMDLLLQWIDFGYTEYASTVWTYGQEGLHWDYDAGGNPQFHDIVINNPDIPQVMFAVGLYCSSNAGPHTQYTFFMNSTYSDLRLGASQYWDQFCDYDDSYNMPPKLTVLPEDASEFSRLWGEVSTYISENVGLFVIGARPMSEWDAFTAQLKTLGADRIVELWQKAYNAYQKL